jgi:hypothetical protein
MTSKLIQGGLVAIYDQHSDAEAAIKSLERAGLDMTTFSIVGRDYHTEEHVLGFYTAGERIKLWGGRGLFWGSLWGMLLGGAFFMVPAFGSLVVLGPLAGWIAGGLEGAAVGGSLGLLTAGFATMGVPKDGVLKYETEVKAGKFLVVVHGSDDMTRRARAVLHGTKLSSLSEHPDPAVPGSVELPAPVALSAPVGLTAPATPPLGQNKRIDYVVRERIMNLLSDSEVASVAKAESASRLSLGDEYIDLERLEDGVLRALESRTPMGRVLPRRNVASATWGKILVQLSGVQP